MLIQITGGDFFGKSWLGRFPFIQYAFFLYLAFYLTGLQHPPHWKVIGNADHDLTYSTYEALRIAIAEHHEFPQFNPYSSGGTDVLANPQAPVGSIILLFVLLFGTVAGIKIAWIVFYFLGVVGANLFLKKIISSNGLAFLGSILFVSLSYFNWHILFAGHSNFLWWFALPWLAWAHYQYFHNNHKKWYYALLMVFIYFQLLVGGAPFIFLYTAIFHVLVFAITQSANWKTNTVHLFFIFLWSIGISLWKLLPSIFWFREYPRHTVDLEGIQPGQWLQAFRDVFVPTNTTDGWHEMAGGNNWLLLLSALIAIYYTKRKWAWIALFLGILWFTLGNYPVGFNPWLLLHKYVPPFTSLRTPMRAVIFIHMLTLVFSLKLFEKLPAMYFVSRIGLLIICYFTISKSKIVSTGFYKENFNLVKQESLFHASSPFQIISKKENKDVFEFTYIQRNIGIINAYEPMDLPTINYPDSMHWIKGGKLIKSTTGYFELEKNRDTMLCALRNIEGNWQWKAKGIKLEKSAKYLLFTGNKGNIVLQYSNPHLKLGIWTSLISILLLICSLWYVQRNKVYEAEYIPEYL